MTPQKILFVVSNNPFSKDRRTILRLLDELLKLNARISIFLHGNGVWWLSGGGLEEFALRGVKIYYGASSAQKRRLDAPEWASLATLEDLSLLMEGADKVLFFN